jgi:hypothetical protein
MSPLPLLRFGSRARSTSIGIALCTMFIVASFSIVGGLKASMERLEGNFSSEYYLVTLPSRSGPDFFEPSEITSVLDRCAYGSFVDVTVDMNGSAAVFYMVDVGKLFPTVAIPVGKEVYVQSGSLGWFNLTSSVATQQVGVVGILAYREFPDDWILGSRELVDSLSGSPGLANFAIADSISKDQREHLVAEGFSVQGMTGIIDFLGQSVEQLQDDIVLILLPSAFVIAVLSYGFIGSETADRRHDIGILKTIGAGRTRILSYLFANASLISLWGGIVGVALGIILSYALSTAVSTVFTSVFIMKVDPSLLGLALIVTVSAAAVGALVPALRMTMSPPVRDLREGAR